MLWQDTQQSVTDALRNSGPDLPAGFGDTFDAAWHEGQLFGSSIASFNARQTALNNYITEIQQKTGKRLAYDAEGGADGWAQINDQAEKLGIKPLPDEEIDRRSAAVAGEAHQAYSEMAAREKTLGGKVGGVLGGLAAGATDPINLIALPVAPEAELGILGTAALWGGYGAVTQAANEAINAPFRQQAVPGYDEAAGNILSAGVGGAVLGGVFKGLGATWTRMKTGEWPRSVRDAGNIVESEANIQQSNVLPGAEGDAAHRQAMGTAIDQILNGHGVDVGTMEASRDLVGRLQPEPGFTLPVINEQAIRLIGEEAGLRQRQTALRSQLSSLPEGDLAAADRLNRLQAVEQQIAGTTDRNVLRALNERRDQILVDTTPEKLQAAAAPFEQRRVLEAERTNIEARLADIEKQQAALPRQEPAMLGQTSPARTLFDVHEGRIDSLMDMRAKALKIGTNAAEERAEAIGQQQLPLVASTLDLVHDLHVNSMAKGIQQLALFAAHDMPEDEARTLAARVARSNTDDEARAILNEVPLRPRTLADTLPSVSAIAKASKAAEFELPALTPKAREETLADPKHAVAMATDLERLRDQGTALQMIPVGVDEKGEPTYQLLDAAIQDAKNDEEAASQLEACVNPPVEEEAPTPSPASAPSVSPAASVSATEAPIEPPASPVSPSVPAVAPAPRAAPVKETPPRAVAEPEILPPAKEDKALDAKIYQTMTGQLRPEFIDTPEFRALSEEHDALALRAVSSKFGRGGFSREDRLRLKDVEGQMNKMLDQEYGTLEKLADEHIPGRPSTIEHHKTIEHDE